MDKADRLHRRLIAACRQTQTPTGLLAAVVEVLRPDVPNDRWCVLTLDPATSLPTGGLHEHGVNPIYAPRMLELEFRGDEVNRLSALARAKQAVATLDGATHGERRRSPRFREVLAPDGLAHELRAVFRDTHGAWAAIVLMRAEGRPDFSAAEQALVAGLAEPVTRALRRVLLMGEISAQARADAPALLMLEGGAHLQVRHASASAAHWLAQIDDGTAADLPYALYSLAQSARSGTHPAMTRLRTRSGRWLTAHAEAVSGHDGEVSLIVQPSRPHEIAQVLSAAYGLTTREAEVARLVAAGCSNPEIAGLLFVSRYTVEDHLKKLYAKLDVKSRSELVSRLFFDEYRPRELAGLPLDGNGWFIGERPSP